LNSSSDNELQLLTLQKDHYDADVEENEESHERNEVDGQETGSEDTDSDEDEVYRPIHHPRHASEPQIGLETATLASPEEAERCSSCVIT